MKMLRVFDHVSVDGFFAGPNGEIDWFHSVKKDDEFDAYTHAQSKSGGMLMFGRTTYEMMKSYWPTDDAIQADPAMARVMNQSPKIVVSKSLRRLEEGPHWKNLRLLHEVERNAVLALKDEADITVLGSGSVVQQLANLGLIDEYQLLVVPVVLGSGKPLFNDVHKMNLSLQDAKAFKNGIVVHRYAAGNGA